MQDTDTRNVADSVFEMLKGGIAPSTQSVSRGTSDNASVLLVPDGMKVTDLKPLLDKYLAAPERRLGHSDHTDLDTFIAWVNRYKSADTVVMARDNRTEPKLVAVFNHHPQGEDNAQAGWTDFRATYHFPLSEEWKEWAKFNGKSMDQAEFAAFIEDRINDVLPPPTILDGKSGDAEIKLPDVASKFLALAGGRCAMPAEIMTLSRGLKVHVGEKVEQQVNVQSGEVALVYSQEHKDAKNEKINVPQIFLVGIPVFQNGQPFVVAARLRYRILGGGIAWSYVLHRADKTFDTAFKEAIKQVADVTKVPTFIGSQS